MSPAHTALVVLTDCGVVVVQVQDLGRHVWARVRRTDNRQAIARARRLLDAQRITLDVSIHTQE